MASKRLIHTFSIFGGLVVLGTLAGVAVWLYPVLAEAHAQRQLDVKHLYQEYLARGSALAEMNHTREAMGYYQMAIETADSPKARAHAGYEMAMFLMKRARKEPIPYAMMARQYLEAAEELMQDPAEKFRAYEGIVECAELLGNYDEVMKAAHTAYDLAPDDAGRVEMLLSMMDAVLDKGSLDEIRDLQEMAEPFQDDPKWKQDFLLREARIGESMLMREDWTEAFLALAEEEEAAVLRLTLMEDTLANYQALFEMGDGELQEECLFRMAQLYAHEGNLDEAARRLQDFLLREPEQHLDETLLLLTKIARLEGRTKTAQDMIARFLRRYGLRRAAVDEVMALIEQLEAEGYTEDALNLVRDYLKYPAVEQEFPEFLAKASSLAGAQGEYEEAARYLTQLTNLDVPNTLASEAMIELARRCYDNNKLKMAEDWLIKLLEEYPYSPNRGEALFLLFDVETAANAYITDIILTGLAAVDVSPGDDRSVDILIQLAGMLEEIGLLEMAQEQYSKVGLIRLTSSDRQGGVAEAVGSAVLGSARCLLRMGDIVKVDHLLREICNNYGPGPVRSEAAYLWATIARDSGQIREAQRRLNLAETDQVSAELAARIVFERNLLDIALGRGTSKGLQDLCMVLTEMTPAEDQVFALKAYEFCFDELARQGDIEGMRELLDVGAAGPCGGNLPVRTYCLKTAEVILRDRGLTAFVLFLKQYEDLFEDAPATFREGVKALLDDADYIEEAQRELQQML